MTSAPTGAPTPVSRDNQSRRRFVAIAVAAVVVAAGGGVGIGAAIAPGNPVAAAKASVDQAIAAGTRAGSYHYTELSTTDGTPYNIVGDANPHGGRQQITSGSSTYTLLLVNGIVYFKGNEASMLSTINAPTSVAVKDANRWIRVPKSASPYQTFAVGITTKSNLSQLTSVIAARSVASGPGGTTVVRGSLILGSGAPPAGTATLTLNASGLPTRLAAQASEGGVSTSDSWTFDHWHQHVSVTAPAHAIPYASLGAIPPSSSGGGGGAPSIGGGPTGA